MDIRKQKRGLKKEVKAWWFRVVLTGYVCIVLLFIVVLLVLSYWCCVLSNVVELCWQGFLVGFAHPSTG